ncbi:efflux RND transporter periplasmic adaptor subunit [Ekhidna sp.]|uniref:efflux RND transporter periplasmic adaptor subunit n=1 Tax=Ekhidna sp. TaxID=2608089 RepID=UPI003CCC214B
MNRAQTILSIVILLILTGGVTFYIFSTEPEAETEGATKQSAMLVEVTRAEQGDFRPIIKATGTVQAARDINLSARVSGEIISISQKFVPGSFVKKGDVLVQVDPADYRNTVLMMESNLESAQAQFKLEMGQQEAAKNDYDLAEGEIPINNKGLLLREPQLNTAKANVKAAEAQLAQAKLDLQRCTIRAPFDAQVVSRAANVGSQVAPGNMLGRLVGTREYWLTLNVPMAKINWLDIPSENEDANPNVKLTNSSWAEGQYRMGALYRMIGTLTDQTRFAQVIVRIDDPTKGKPRIIIGSFMEAEIPAQQLNDVVRLNRDYLRKDQTVWVKNGNELSVKEVEVAFLDEKYAYITKGLTGDDQIITTSLSTVVEGSAVRTEQNEEK